jgi:5'-methylthioadenosine phosphorylase
MTNLTEARLCREAEICYATLTLVTDYDCWRESTEAVSVESVLALLEANAAAARSAMREAVRHLDPNRQCACRDSMRHAIITDRAAISDSAKERLRPIVGRYL